MVQSITRSLTGLLFVFLVCGVCAFGQTARLSGHVTDPDGIPLAGATVQAVHQGDSVTQKTITDETGAYSFTQLAAGDYQIVADNQGFETYKGEIVHLAENQTLVVDAKMAIATAQTNVNVEAQGAGQVTLDTAALSGTLESKEVTSYGLNGRNFSQLIALTPGVSNQTGQDEAKVGVAGSAKFSVNGGRVEYNTFEVDGSDVLNTSINASRGQGLPLMVYPSVDAIESMQVLTSNYGAMYGKSASGSVLVTTKSGTSKFHGNVYGFIRNEMFNARNYFDPADPANPLEPNAPLRYRTPLYRRQDYGGTIGGPIYIPGHFNTTKDKTYFFWSEELRLEKTPVDYNQAVPTVAERSGDFSDVCPYSPGGGAPSAVGYSDCPINSGTSPSNGSISGQHVNVNYLSQAILNSNIIPLPNSQSGCNSTNTSTVAHCYNAAVSPPTYWREELFRIDQALTPTELLSFRYIHDSWNTTTLTPQWGVVQNSFPTVENKLTGPGLDMVLSLSQSLPHSFQNRVSFAFSVEHISLAGEKGPGVTSLARPAILDNAGSAITGGAAVARSSLCSVVTGPQQTPPSPNTPPQQLTECPMGRIFNNGFGGKMPGLVFQGNNGAYGGHGFSVDTGYTPWNQSNPSYTLRDDASKVVGKHSLQFGFEATIVQQNELSAASGANSGDLQGRLTFSNQQSKYTTGNAFADFLAGPGLIRLIPNGTGLQLANTDYTQTAIKSFTQDSGQARYYNRYKSAEIYLQDDWRITNRLTLNIGFRGSFFGAWYNPNGTAYNWEPQAYSQSLKSSIFIDPSFGELVYSNACVSSCPGNGSGSLPTVPLDLTNSNARAVITNGLVQCGKNGVPDSCMTNHLFNPAPRVGFAWDPTGSGRTSIRAGYGLFWEHGIGNEANTGSLIGSAPLVLSETQSNPTAVDLIGSGIGSASNSGPLNSIGFVSSGFGSAASVTAGTFPLNVTAIPTQQHYSYTQQWSLSVQRELLKDVVGTIAYVGTKGTHLTAIRDLNQLPALAPGLNPFASGQPMTSGICAAGAVSPNIFPVNGTYNGGGGTQSAGIGPNQPGYLNALIACTGSAGFKGTSGILGISADVLRPYLGFSNIISVENIADSQYHALQATVRRTKASLTLGATYTYSHGLDDSSDRSSANFADSLNIKSNRSSSDFDQRHLINFSYIYELPLLRLLSHFTSFIDADQTAASAVAGHSTGGIEDSRILRGLLDNWQLSGITVYQSGTPFSIVNGGGQGISSAIQPDAQGGVATADNAGVGNGLGVGSYPDIAPAPHGTKPVVAANGSTLGPLLGNPRAFMAPRGLTFGNAGRNYMNNPARTNFNMALLKTFKIFKEKDTEFRVEAFNVFNHTQFRIYDPSHPGNTGNNVISCYGDISTGYSAGAPGCVAGNSFLHPVDAHDPRILQFGLKLSY